MALLFADGFEHYGTGGTSRTNMLSGAWSIIGSGHEVVSTRARTGSRSLQSINSTNSPRVLLRNSGHNEIGVALGIYFVGMPVDDARRAGFAIRDASGDLIVSARVKPDGSIELSGFNGVLGTTDAGLIVASSWQHVELRVLQDNVVGEVELRVDGQVSSFLTNLDLGLNPPTFWQVHFSSLVSNPTVNYDDLIIWDTTGDVNNDFFGPARVTTIWLDGDVSGNQWSVTGGATGAAAMTETAPDGDTSYVSAAVVNRVSEFSIEELPPEAEVIAGVYIPTMAKLAVAGVGSMQTSVVSGSDVETGADNPLTTAYTYRGDVFEKDPATGQQWTKSGLEAALIRIEKTA